MIDSQPEIQINEINPPRAQMLPEDLRRMNETIIAHFRSNGGSITEGGFKGAPILLLSTTGARSGKVRLTPVAYTLDGDRFVIIASNGGAPRHPDWYQNLIANSRVTVEVGSERFTARASIAEGAERDRLFDAHAQVMPMFADYQRQTSRQIPVVILDRLD